MTYRGTYVKKSVCQCEYPMLNGGVPLGKVYDLGPLMITRRAWLVCGGCGQCRPGCTAVVVGDGAVGSLGVLSARHMGAGRMIAMSRHDKRQALSREFATDSVAERGDEAVPALKT